MPLDHIDSAMKLLLDLDEEQGERALVILAGAGLPAAALASRFKDVYCHNTDQPLHVAAKKLLADRGLANVHCVLGDIPCADRNGVAPAESAAEIFLSSVRFPENHFDLITFRLGRGTAQINATMMEGFRLLKPGACLIVSGHNQEGIKSFIKRVAAYFGDMELLKVKASCRLVRFRKMTTAPAGSLEDPKYFQPVPLSLEYTGGGKVEYLTKPGIFAYRATDPGTAMLALNLPDCSGKSILDLGCGSGALALAAFKLGAKEVLATDISCIATEVATHNFKLHGVNGETLCTDLTEGVEREFDLIFTNPPFHKDGDTDYTLPGRILDALIKHLKPGGKAFLVANQFLDYSIQARKLFSDCKVVARNQSYTVHCFTKSD